MRYFYFSLFLILTLPVQLRAQPANDDCANAILLNDITSWCSAPAAYTLDGATESGIASPACWPTTQPNHDVWFSFVAGATTVNVSVIGNVVFNQGGTLEEPQVAVYAGSCESLTEIECISDAFNTNAAETFAGPLVVGDTYYIRVGARNNNMGTFELCVNNFNEVPQPSGDCEPGVILCDKSPFTVDFVIGEGNNPNEINDTGCNGGGCNFTEASSSWYKWTCDEAGTLAFSLTPLNPSDDLDFVVYELPNGIDDCSGKFDIRCMASGENVGEPFANWEPCTGATGLSLTETDFSESCGCQVGNNNFAAAIDMEAGKSYALVINNFSNSGSGFSIEFDGTGTFLGPEAAFEAVPQTVCVGEPVTFTDASTFVGTLVGWSWNFGAGANPATRDGQGAHTVTYSSPGIKSVLLTVETDRGCVVTEIATIEVVCCDDHFTTGVVPTDVACANTPTGALDITATSDFGPYVYQWSNGAVTEDLTGVLPGEYLVTVTDAAGCEVVIDGLINSPDSIEIDTFINMPTCNGGTDGAVQLQVSGGVPPYQFNWQNAGFTDDNSLLNISQGDYSVIVRDANGCEIDLLIPVRELQLTLDPGVEAITPPSCAGFSDGSIQVVINNGLPPYQYNFNDGNGYVNANALNNLPAGAYQVDVLDANLCSGQFTFVIEDYAPLEIELDAQNVSCFGESDGSIAALATGGVGNYLYSWNNGASSQTIGDLPIGDYSVTVLDGNGCETSAAVTIIQPDPVFIEVLDVVDNLCNGEAAGAITVGGSGGNPPFEYSIDGATFQSDSVFNGLPAGTYTLTVLDMLGCTATTTTVVNEPPSLVVDAGPDQHINLGFTATVQASSSDPFVTYSWSPLDSLICLDPECTRLTLDPVNTTTYTVTVVDEAGCISADSVTIFIVKDRPVYIPNAISPNDDGFNDFFTLYGGPAVREIRLLQIFDRWGELIFDGKGVSIGKEEEGWNGEFKGRPVNPGVFVYLAEVVFIDGEVVLFKGDVTVVR